MILPKVFSRFDLPLFRLFLQCLKQGAQYQQRSPPGVQIEGLDVGISDNNINSDRRPVCRCAFFLFFPLYGMFRFCVY